MNSFFDIPKTPAGSSRSAPNGPPVLFGTVVDVLASLGEEALELLVALLAMIIVEHVYGQSGLGIYAYLTSCLYVLRYVSGFGVAHYAERETAAFENHPRQQRAVMGRGYQATLFAGLAAAALLLLTAGFDSSHTRIEERIGAYLVLALIVPLANLNALKLSIMQGLGHHARVSTIRTVRYLVFFASLLLMVHFRLRPSFLLIAFLPADCLAAVLLRCGPLEPLSLGSLKRPRAVLHTLRQGSAYLFTDNALDVLLTIDLLVLGLFVDAWHLGVYAEVAVLVRIALLVPVAIKPILRRRYNIAVADRQEARAARLFKRTTIALFCLNAVLALYTLLHYSEILDLLFTLGGEQELSLDVFKIFIPGLIFYGAFSAQEPIYEAVGRVRALRKLTIVVAISNLCWGLFLVPLAGIDGAAAATMLSMFLYFALFGGYSSGRDGFEKRPLLVCGLAIYLVYVVLRHLALPAAVTIWLVPLMLSVTFYLVGLFGVSTQAEGEGLQL